MGLKELKTNFIVDVATSLFLERSISSVTIKDIAEKADVGEMTVYRYFQKKQNIVLAAVLKLERDITKFYFDLSRGNTGFEKMQIFYNSYISIFNDKPHYYQFIKEFDLYMYENGSQELLEGYQEKLDAFKVAFLAAYEEGLKDGSIKKLDNVSVFYFATTHALLELCKKLSYKEGLLSQDLKIEKKEELKVLVGIILNQLKQS